MSILLNTNAKIPKIGFGTWDLQKGKEVDSIVAALKIGYRHLDTAKMYGTEEFIAQALKKADIPRESVFITSKLENEDQGFESTLNAIDGSLQRLNTDYVDLYLIHWPCTDGMEGENKRKETWKAMEQILSDGKARAIGVSNFLVEHLKEMKEYAEITPAVNQIECHPLWNRKDILTYCKENGIIVTAYSPLTRTEALENKDVIAIADAHGKTPAQILLRWNLQKGNVVIPKSSDINHIKQNYNISNFILYPEEMDMLDNLNNDQSVL